MSFTLRGRRGTLGTCWRGRRGTCGRRGCWRGRCGTWRHPPLLWVADVAPMALDWLWWRGWVSVGRRGRRGCWRGRRGTYRTGLALVARLGLRWTPRSPRLLAWQAWHLVTSTFTLRGRRGTWRHPPLLCVAGVDRCGTYGTGLALVARLGAWVSVGRRGRRGCWRGRHGTWRHPPLLCVGGVSLGDIDRHFAWQGWHFWHWTGSGGALGSPLDAAVVAAGGVAGVAGASWSKRRKTRRWLRMPTIEQTCDWRAVRKSIVAATGPVVCATRLPRRVKI